MLTEIIPKAKPAFDFRALLFGWLPERMKRMIVVASLYRQFVDMAESQCSLGKLNRRLDLCGDDDALVLPSVMFTKLIWGKTIALPRESKKRYRLAMTIASAVPPWLVYDQPTLMAGDIYRMIQMV